MCLFCLPAGASVSSDHLQEEAEEAELVAAVRQLVAERFSSNPAYQLLKGRFLSCFTVPALLATVQPIAEKTGTHQANKEEEEQEEEEVELKKIKERGKQRRAEVSHSWKPLVQERYRNLLRLSGKTKFDVLCPVVFLRVPLWILFDLFCRCMHLYAFH